MKKALSLVELMIVMLVIGLMAIFIIPAAKDVANSTQKTKADIAVSSQQKQPESSKKYVDEAPVSSVNSGALGLTTILVVGAAGAGIYFIKKKNNLNRAQ